MLAKSKVLMVLAIAVMGLNVALAEVVVNVDFENDPSQSSSVTYSGQGAMASPGNIWNTVNPGVAPTVYFWGEHCSWPTSFSSGALVDSEGNSTSMTVAVAGISGTYTWTGYEPSPAPNWTTHQALMEDWIIQASDSVDATVTISGLTPNGIYNLIVYGHSHEGGGNTVFTIGGTTQTTTTTESTEDHPLTAGYDYLTFNNVAASALGDIVIGFHDAPGGNQGGFMGFQISQVPEPSALMLLSMSAAGLLAYAWRKRR